MPNKLSDEMRSKVAPIDVLAHNIPHQELCSRPDVVFPQDDIVGGPLVHRWVPRVEALENAVEVLQEQIREMHSQLIG